MDTRARGRHTVGQGGLLVSGLLLAALVAVPPLARAQSVEHRGFAEATGTAYPDTSPVDPTQAVLDALFRYEGSWRAGAWKVDGALDARADTNEMTERRAAPAFWDRTIQRPMFAVRRLSASWSRGAVAIALGKQIIRWGKTDILTPTDRFAPRDYLTIVNTDVLGVTAARATVANSTDALEVVVAPRMTPSRMPLFDQRWVVLPLQAAGLTIVDTGAQYPEGTQVGVRWNHIGRWLEHSVSVYRGHDHLPLIAVEPRLAQQAVAVRRDYAQLSAVGADLAAPLPWFTLKAEAAWLGSDTRASQEVLLYVVQAERQAGEWLFIAGYAGEYVRREPRTFRFSPDRGLAKAFVGRASLTIDTNRSFTIESVVRRNGDGLVARGEYSQALGPHWRATGQVALFGGVDGDYLGQYRHNSFAAMTLRYSF